MTPKLPFYSLVMNLEQRAPPCSRVLGRKFEAHCSAAPAGGQLLYFPFGTSLPHLAPNVLTSVEFPALKKYTLFKYQVSN
jgi:hypothetical protein